MEVFLMYLLFVVGLVLIIKGGDFFVDAAAWIAEISGIPHFIVGATIVGFATSLPEIIVSVIAAAGGKVDMATGNAVGSVTANTGLILGISLVAMPMVISLRRYLPQIALLVGSIALIWIFGFTSGYITAVAAVVLVVLFGLFAFLNITNARKEMALKADEAAVKRDEVTKAIVIKKLCMFVFGCAGIVIGSELLVEYGSQIALSWGVDERIISVSAVAIGTSLPELVTTVAAITKKESSLSVGNILGSNIIDMTIVLPPCLLAYGKSIPISQGTLFVDLPVLFGLSCLCFVPSFFTRKFARWQGVALLGAYLIYMVYVFISH